MAGEERRGWLRSRSPRSIRARPIPAGSFRLGEREPVSQRPDQHQIQQPIQNGLLSELLAKGLGLQQLQRCGALDSPWHHEHPRQDAQQSVGHVSRDGEGSRSAWRHRHPAAFRRCVCPARCCQRRCPHRRGSSRPRPGRTWVQGLLRGRWSHRRDPAHDDGYVHGLQPAGLAAVHDPCLAAEHRDQGQEGSFRERRGPEPRAVPAGATPDRRDSLNRHLFRAGSAALAEQYEDLAIHYRESTSGQAELRTPWEPFGCLTGARMGACLSRLRPRCGR